MPVQNKAFDIRYPSFQNRLNFVNRQGAVAFQKNFTGFRIYKIFTNHPSLKIFQLNGNSDPLPVYTFDLGDSFFNQQSTTIR